MALIFDIATKSWQMVLQPEVYIKAAQETKVWNNIVSKKHLEKFLSTSLGGTAIPWFESLSATETHA